MWRVDRALWVRYQILSIFPLTGVRWNTSPSLFLWSEQWKQDDVADRLRTGEQHGEPIHAHAKAAGRWHAVLEREQKFLVDLLGFFASLLEQTLPLRKRIDEEFLLAQIGRAHV